VQDGKSEHIEIIADNEYSRMLLKWISMEDKELEGKTGSAATSCYRSALIGQLLGLWD
jgi:hypothetical protein